MNETAEASPNPRLSPSDRVGSRQHVTSLELLRLFGGLSRRLWSSFCVASFVGLMVSHRTSGCSTQFAMTDGSVRFISDSVPVDVFRALGTRNQGEVVQLP